MIAAGSEPLPDAAFRKCILVVEDEVLIRSMLSDELRDLGLHVVEACDADEAVEFLNTRQPLDLIISDICMPGSMDGLGLLKVVKSTLPDLPVIIVSGHLDPGFAMMHGAAQFIEKPFMFDAVIQAVISELGKRT